MSTCRLFLFLVVASGCNTFAFAAGCEECIQDLLSVEPRRESCIRACQESPNLYSALARLIDYLEASHVDDPDILLLLDVVERNFGRGRFHNVRERYDRVLASQPRNAHMLRLFQRVMVRETPLDPADLTKLTTDFDPMTARALHCDRRPVGLGFSSVLRYHVDQGGYALTHAALAWLWIKENKCPLPLPESFEEEIVDLMVALIDSGLPVHDLEIESAALLHALGYGARVSEAFIDQVLAVQSPGGGYTALDVPIGGPNLHTSVLALWLLLQHALPGAGPRRMLAPPNPITR